MIYAIRLDTLERRHIARELALDHGARDGAVESPIITHAKDEWSGSTTYLLVDVEGARHASEALMENWPLHGERQNLWAELQAIYQAGADL